MKPCTNQVPKTAIQSTQVMLPTPGVIITHVELNINPTQSLCSQIPFQQSTMYLTELLASSIIGSLLSKVKQVVFENSCVKKKLNPYGMVFTSLCLKENLELHLNQGEASQSINDDQEPSALRNDNLIPVAIDIEHKTISHIQNPSIRESFMSTPGQFIKNTSYVSKKSKNNLLANNADTKKTPKTMHYVQLKSQDLPKLQVSFDPYVQQFRRQKQAKLVQAQQNKKTENKPTLREIIKKDEKVSYDFTGEIIKIKQNQKGNFIQDQIEWMEKQSSTKKQKQSKGDSNPVNLDFLTRKGLEKRTFSKKTQDIQFSNIVSLTPQFEILDGVKFVQGKNVVEKKKKTPSINEIKKAISHQKLSKIDFDRLKSQGDKNSIKSIISKAESSSFPMILKSQTDLNNDINDSILGRSMSEAKIQEKSRFSLKSYNNLQKQNLTYRSHDKVSVENEQLVDMLIQPVYNSLEDSAVLKLANQNNEKAKNIKIQALSAMDKANLNFMKTGSVGRVELPRINHRSLANDPIVKASHPITLLESKTKIQSKRKQNEFEKTRKIFEDKLRT